MARITEKDLKKLILTNRYKGTISHGPKWFISRKGRESLATFKAAFRELYEPPCPTCAGAEKEKAPEGADG